MRLAYMEICISYLLSKITNSLNLQMTLTKFWIKSGSQCQRLTFPARLVVNCLRCLILTCVTDPTAAVRQGREPLSYPTGVTTQGEGLLAREPPDEGNCSSHGRPVHGSPGSRCRLISPDPEHALRSLDLVTSAPPGYERAR
jgi:hypothetical protein